VCVCLCVFVCVFVCVCVCVYVYTYIYVYIYILYGVFGVFEYQGRMARLRQASRMTSLWPLVLAMCVCVCVCWVWVWQWLGGWVAGWLGECESDFWKGAITALLRLY
jgi:hypothetical protein